MWNYISEFYPEKNGRFNEEIFSTTRDFNRNEKKVAALQAITVDDFLGFFETYLISESRRKISVQVCPEFNQGIHRIHVLFIILKWKLRFPHDKGCQIPREFQEVVSNVNLTQVYGKDDIIPDTIDSEKEVLVPDVIAYRKTLDTRFGDNE